MARIEPALQAVGRRRYATAHLRRGELDGVRILQPESYADLWAIQAQDTHPDAEIDSALGWWVRRGTRELVVSHSGEDDGFVSHLRLWTESQLSIVVLCNSVWAEPWTVTDEIYRLVSC